MIRLLCHLILSFLAMLGAAIVLAIVVTIADLYLTGHSITSPDLHTELPGIQMSWGGIVMMGGALVTGVGTFVILHKAFRAKRAS